jgi:hypothetical protein
MMASEQAPDQDVLADQQPGASTFPGTATSGGWIPILSQPKDGSMPFISDWICPACHRLTGNYRTCPQCGLEVKASPRRHAKEPLPKGAKVALYLGWEKIEYQGPQNRHSHRNAATAKR